MPLQLIKKAAEATVLQCPECGVTFPLGTVDICPHCRKAYGEDFPVEEVYESEVK
jgi:rubrerythrin